ncbi:uncharacterized protein LOC126946626 isoform X1 [Macaca thibetana thibetana]|uniref:uncharacterized protein LOC126946626 isoform X1 n=1 Tax=Macaca thibetana thibetana TaxID=257877 RepID=UPI0021BC9BEE|nr:uncharacterized protein LOC126946626 isoform X1 [Macaca thibetana thibetana]
MPAGRWSQPGCSRHCARSRAGHWLPRSGRAGKVLCTRKADHGTNTDPMSCVREREGKEKKEKAKETYLIKVTRQRERPSPLYVPQLQLRYGVRGVFSRPDTAGALSPPTFFLKLLGAQRCFCSLPGDAAGGGYAA